MRPSPRVRGLVLLGALASLVLACSDGGPSGSAWRRIGDIDHLVADDLPDGWVVSTATLRPGRPTSEWAYRADVFVDDASGSLVVVTASDFTPPGVTDLPPGSPPGDPVDVEVNDLAFGLAYSGVAAPDDPAARQIG